MDEEGACNDSRSNLGPGGGGADLITALPEDMLHQVLLRLDSARAAADTSLLSRQWRGLWTRLPRLTVTLHDVPFRSLVAVLGGAARPGVHLLDILVSSQDGTFTSQSSPWQDGTLPDPSVSSLLRAAAELSPVELRLDLPLNSWMFLCLPRFGRTTSIDLRARCLRLAQPWRTSAGGFPSVERLSLSGWHVDLAALIPLCPCLRVLNVNTVLLGMGSIIIHSASLQELVVDSVDSIKIRTCRVDVQAPVLRQLTLSFHARGDLGVSVLAPTVEKVSWHCTYAREIYRLGIWGLLEVGVKPADRPGYTDSGKNACSQLPIVNALSLYMCAQVAPFTSANAELRFPAEINKHMITNFSCLDLHLRTTCHVFGALVLRLLGMDRIRTSIRNLKIVLLRSEVKVACPINCPCDEPNDWRTQTISLADLEKVEIEGVEGEDHEFDFLKVIFRCAPMLGRVTVKLSDGVTPSIDWCTEINNIFMAYPFVEGQHSTAEVVG